MQVDGLAERGNPNKLHLQWYKARTSPPSSQKYDTILKRENMFLCGQTADQLFAHVFHCCVLVFFFFFVNQCSQTLWPRFLFFLSPAFLWKKKKKEESEAEQAVYHRAIARVAGVSCLLGSV